MTAAAFVEPPLIRTFLPCDAGDRSGSPGYDFRRIKKGQRVKRVIPWLFFPPIPHPEFSAKEQEIVTSWGNTPLNLIHKAQRDAALLFPGVKFRRTRVLNIPGSVPEETLSVSDFKDLAFGAIYIHRDDMSPEEDPSSTWLIVRHAHLTSYNPIPCL